MNRASLDPSLRAPSAASAEQEWPRWLSLPPVRRGRAAGAVATLKRRNAGCRVTTGLTLEGYELVVLENELFRLAMLPGKGTDVVELLHKPTDTDFMWWTALGLRSPSPVFDDFQSQYEGGWQEIFPNLGAPQALNGVVLPGYGEVSLVPWACRVTSDEPDHVAVCFSCDLRTMPFSVEKTVRLRRGVAGFEIEERATNNAPVRLHADWGQHITFGEPFLVPGATLHLPSPGRADYTVPGRGAPGGFEVLKDLSGGEYRVVSLEGLGARVAWDKDVWPYLWFWRDFGGEHGAPYFGRHFNVGLEPFSSPPTETLSQSVSAGTALAFEPGQSRTAWLHFEVIRER